MPLNCTAGFQESGLNQINISSPTETKNEASNPRKFVIAISDLAIVFLKNREFSIHKKKGQLKNSHAVAGCGAQGHLALLAEIRHAFIIGWGLC